MRIPREVGLRVCCGVCDSPLVRKVRRVGRFVSIQCKTCGHSWKELQDDGVVHGLVILAPGRR